MPDIAALVTPPLLMDSTGHPANGDIYVSLTADIPVTGGIATPTRVRGLVTAGTFTALDGSAFNIPVTPAGVGAQIFVELREDRPASSGNAPAKYKIRRTVSVPNQSTVTWADLVDVVPVESGTEYAVPAWVQPLLDDAVAAGATALNALNDVQTIAATVDQKVADVPTPAAIATQIEDALDGFEGGISEAELSSAVAPKLDKTEASVTYATNTSVTLELTERAAPVVADIMANDPTIADAAAERALSSAGLSLKSDPGVPNATGTTRDLDYAEAVADQAGNISEATGLDGVKVLPRAEVATARFENLPGVENPYVHATVDAAGNIAEDALGLDGRVPAWVLDAWKGRMGAGVTGTDVLIVAGQSNATERSSLPVSVADADPRIVQWNHSTGTAEMVSATATEWIGNAFAREYVKTNPNRRVLIVPTANGSTGFTTTTITPAPAGYHVVSGEPGKGTWDRTLTADPVNHYAQMIARAQAAIAWAGGRVLAVLWSQGEADRSFLTEAQYAAKLDDLIGATRTALGVPALPFIIGSMTPETIWDNSNGTAAISAAILDTPRRVQSTAYVWGPPNMVEYLNGRVHWAPQGQAERARRMAAEGLNRARLNVVASKPVQAQNVRIERSGGQAVIRWDAPPARVTAYTLETSTDSGTTWTPATLAGPIVTEHSLTATATSPLWVRIKTTNEIGTTDWTREAKS